MHYEISVYLDEKPCKVFLQDGFYTYMSYSKIIHKHNYTEIHIVSGGSATFKISKETITVMDGEILVIPRGVFHSWVNESPLTLHSAFQIDLSIDTPSVIATDTSVVRGMFNEIAKCNESKDHSVITAYIPLLCSYLKKARTGSIPQVVDYGIIIESFFSTCYDRQVNLCDLADMLHLSERQTERLVKEHTGNTFKEELAATRITVARHLLDTTDMSLSEIAQYVGYRSYAGFWKAMKKYGS